MENKRFGENFSYTLRFFLSNCSVHLDIKIRRFKHQGLISCRSGLRLLNMHIQSPGKNRPVPQKSLNSQTVFFLLCLHFLPQYALCNTCIYKYVLIRKLSKNCMKLV